jgi:hypothetical protein
MEREREERKKVYMNDLYEYEAARNEKRKDGGECIYFFNKDRETKKQRLGTQSKHE